MTDAMTAALTILAALVFVSGVALAVGYLIDEKWKRR